MYSILIIELHTYSTYWYVDTCIYKGQLLGKCTIHKNIDMHSDGRNEGMKIQTQEADIECGDVRFERLQAMGEGAGRLVHVI